MASQGGQAVARLEVLEGWRGVCLGARMGFCCARERYSDRGLVSFIPTTARRWWRRPCKYKWPGIRGVETGGWRSTTKYWVWVQVPPRSETVRYGVQRRSTSRRVPAAVPRRVLAQAVPDLRVRELTRASVQGPVPFDASYPSSVVVCGLWIVDEVRGVGTGAGNLSKRQPPLYLPPPQGLHLPRTYSPVNLEPSGSFFGVCCTGRVPVGMQRVRRWGMHCVSWRLWESGKLELGQDGDPQLATRQERISIHGKERPRNQRSSSQATIEGRRRRRQWKQLGKEHPGQHCTVPLPVETSSVRCNSASNGSPAVVASCSAIDDVLVPITCTWNTS